MAPQSWWSFTKCLKNTELMESVRYLSLTPIHLTHSNNTSIMDRVFRSLSGTVRAAMLTWQLLPFSSALGKNTSTYASVTLIAPHRLRGRLWCGWDGRCIHPGTAVGKRRLRGALGEDLLLEGEDGIQQQCVVVPFAADDDAEVLGAVEVLVEAADLTHLEGTEIRDVASGV